MNTIVNLSGKLGSIGVHRLHRDDNKLTPNRNTIRELDLSGNQINSIEDYYFSDFTQLQDLNMAMNNLTTINNRTFSGLNKLRRLNLLDNPISINRDGAGVLSDLRNLTSLSLTSMSSFQPAFFRFPHESLKSLFFVKGFANTISTLNLKMLSELVNLKFLSIQGFNNLFVHTQLLNRNPGVEYLDLSNNGIEHIPSDLLYGLERLKRLNLSNNRIEDFRFLKAISDCRVSLIGNTISSEVQSKLHNKYPEIRFRFGF